MADQYFLEDIKPEYKPGHEQQAVPTDRQYARKDFWVRIPKDGKNIYHTSSKIGKEAM
jgi:hypothetical protein